MSDWDPRDHIPEFVRTLLQRPNPNYTLALFHLLETLKLQRRTGWVNHNIANPESISDHMYRMGIMSLLLPQTTTTTSTSSNDKLTINRDRCMKIALVHDLAESIVGDITPFDEKVDKDEKHRREVRAIQYICNDIIRPVNRHAAEDIQECWNEYEFQSTTEGRYVKDIDKYEMLVQCFEYERVYGNKRDLSQFYGAVQSIKTEEVKQWARELLIERERFFAPKDTESS